MICIKRCVFIPAILSLMLIGFAQAEDRSISEAEKMASAPGGGNKANLETLKRAKLTEEEAIKQLKYMMVLGWARMEEQLREEGTFAPFGFTLMPDGEFKAVILNSEGVRLNPGFTLDAVTQNLKAIAETRSVWAVGIMYIHVKEKSDGTYDQRIQVMTEHIAGWARHWSYPFKTIDGDVKLGAPTEMATKPVYFSKK